MSNEYVIPTRYGEGRMVAHRARSPKATLLLTHGAGNGIDTADLEALGADLPRQGVSVVLFEQPWKVAGRPVASAPATLDVGLIAAADFMRARTPLVIGGRSAGARASCRVAKSLGAVGCLALSFPLHPPGKPEKSRVEELRGTGLPTLVIQGERDPMGRPEEFPQLSGVDLAVVPGADHGLKVAKSGPIPQDVAWEIVVESTLEWLVREIVGELG
ncbi:alpha/beta family hydrolase [Nocardioides insulae]|uniref:alpha/beta hydrolase family protein n=1 Tax=Nocardioides insulae TaxID=394734 RepID=UPI001FE1D576|nr:alpha/beta family hydrolase [Nocardioides insulae]